MLRAGVLLALLGLAHAVNDPKIFDVKKITTFGENAFPMFSPEGRFLYFQSKGAEYGTTCTRIYQADLNNLKTEPISLFSSGIGDEFRLSPYKVYSGNYASFVSTNTYWLQDLYTNVNQSITANSWCAQSKCASPTDPDLQAACTADILAYTEHYDYTALNVFTSTGVMSSEKLTMVEQDANDWRNPPVVIDYYNSVGSGKCSLGECIMKDGNVAKMNYFYRGGAAFDGFSYNPSKRYNPNKYFFFHGYLATDEWKRNAIRQGVVPTAGSRVYRSTYDKINVNTQPDALVPNNDGMTYLWPQPTNNENQAIATGIDPNAKTVGIYLLEIGQTPVLLSDLSVNTYHAVLDSTNQYIAFVSDRDGKANIYMGKYLDSKIADPTYYPSQPKPSLPNLFAKPMETPLCYHNPSNDDKIYSYGSTRLSSDKLIFVGSSGYGSDCSQIFISDINKNDTSVTRKISTGFHAHNSPSFIKGTDNILFGSTLTQQYDTEMDVTDCHIGVCSYGSPKKDKYPLSSLCNQLVKEKSLPPSMELYISNKYGAIQQRLTTHAGFDGDAAVSPDGKTVVYSSFTGKDYDLFLMNIDGTGKKQLTNTLGYEGGTTFSPDGKFIAYYASRPNTTGDVKTYKQMMTFDFTDVGRTEIFIYSFDTGKEYQLSNVGSSSCHSPTFMSKGKDNWSYRLVFISDNGAEYNTGSVKLNGAVFNAPKDSTLDRKTILIDRFYSKIWDLNVQGDSLAFSYDQDICIVNKFDPNFKTGSNALAAKASVFVLFLSFVLSKFL